MATGVVSETDSILSRWLQGSTVPAASLGGGLQNLQHQAAARLQELHLPTRKDEEWRFTDIAELAAIAWQGAPAASEVAVPDGASWMLPEAKGQCLVFVNGHYAPALSDTSALPAGIIAGNAEAARDLPWEDLGGDSWGDVFATLNAASFRDAAIVRVPAGTVVERPIQLLFLTAPTDGPILVQPRAYIVAETSASVTVVEQFASLAATEAHFTNAATEISVAPNARVAHIRLQQEASETGFHIGRTHVRQERDSHYAGSAIAVGAKFSRHNVAVSLGGDLAEVQLHGLTVVGDDCLADTHSEIVHCCPNGTSSQLHKCLLDGRSRGVFNGKIFVPQAAQQTNAAQLNRNLLLSPKARIDTKPELQITADNVKCSHGATVSQLEADEVFYLRSRGLSEAAARHLLVDAFAAEILNYIPVPSLRDRLAATLFTRS